MKILFITVLVTVTFIHGSTGCCSCKNAFNGQLTAFYKLFMKNFNLVLENRPGSQNCPPCSTFCPVDSTSECPGMGPRPSANTCTKINFQKVMNAGPINIQGIPVNIHRTHVASNSDNVIIFTERTPRELQYTFNYQEYCGLYQATRKPSEQFPSALNAYLNAYSADISTGQVYVAGHIGQSASSKARVAIFKIPINSGNDGVWTEFVLSSPLLGHNYPKHMKWSKDGEKMVIIVCRMAQELGTAYVYDKHGKRIRQLSACGGRGTVGPIAFDTEGNIVIVGSTSGTADTICVYHKDTYQVVKTFKPLNGRASLRNKCLYIHCDGTVITCSSGNLFFMDKDYKVVHTMNTNGPGNGYYSLAVTTSDGLMRAFASNRMDIYKLF